MGIMVDERRGSHGKPEGQQRAGLAAGLGWVPPCLGALGTGAALGALCAFQENVGLRRGFCDFAMLANWPQFQGGHLSQFVWDSCG